MKQNGFLQYLYFLFLKDSFALEGRASRLQYIARIFISLGLYALSTLGHQSAIMSGILVAILFLYATLLKVRRLHDLDFSGWWLIVMMPSGFILMIALSIIIGTKGKNRYGEEAKF